MWLLKFSVIALVAVLISDVICPVYGLSEADKSRFLSARVKEQVRQLGTDPNAQVEVTLNNDTRLKGYIRQILDEGFVFIDGEDVVTVRYEEVKALKRRQRWPKALKVGLIIGGAVAFAVYVRGLTSD